MSRQTLHLSHPPHPFAMKYQIKLYVGGRVFVDTVLANNQQEAIETAQRRNPQARVIAVNASFL